MIANERQYRMTKAWLERFEEGLTHADEAAAGLDPLLQGAMRDQYTGQVAELREQLAHYDALQAGHIRTLALRSLDDIPLILVQARIAAGLTHKQLATLLAMPEQQVQRYEAREYQGVSFDRLQMVADALGVIIEGRARLPHPAESAGQADEDIGAPVVEEDLVAVKRGEEESRVHPHKDVMQGQQTISVPVTREEVIIERTSASGDYTANVAGSFKKRDIEVPMMGEELVADKRAHVVEEVRLRKDVVTENEQISDIARKERVVVEDAANATGARSHTIGNDIT